MSYSFVDSFRAAAGSGSVLILLLQQKQSHRDLRSESGQAVHRYKWSKVR
jgi:hypothetical protein